VVSVDIYIDNDAALFGCSLVWTSNAIYCISTPRALLKMTQRHRSVAEEPVTSVLPDGDVPYDSSHALTADEEVLAALGYKSEFKREFSLFTTFCVSFAVLGLLPSFASTLYYGMGYAGTAGMTWGWVVAMLGIQCVAMSMAELCSSMPTSGGLYYAAAVLAPPGWGPFAAWITGWSNWCAQVTAAPSGEDMKKFEKECSLTKIRSQLWYLGNDTGSRVYQQPIVYPQRLAGLPSYCLHHDPPRNPQLHAYKMARPV
jgi:hypothetical protein